MEKYFYFYDLNEVLIDRYPAKIASLISTITNTNNFVFIYSYHYEYAIPNKIPNGSKVFYLKNLSQKKLDEIISQYPPNSLTTIAQRIPDMWMLTYFNHLYVPTFIVQHGLWSDKMERLPLVPLIIAKFSKFYNYLKHIHDISRMNNIPFFPTVMDLYNFFLKENKQIPETKYLHNDMLRANYSFVFDESWDDYYVNKYGYNILKLVYIGNPDFMQLKDIITHTKEDAVCYLCQTIIEDKRYPLSKFEAFLKILEKEIIPYKKLYIKLHPRTKVDNYNILRNYENVVFVNHFPNCKYYIGHYSSIISVAKQCSDKILLWKLEDHNIPEYFQRYAQVVTNNAEHVRLFINDTPTTNSKSVNSINVKILSKKEINEINPIKIIAKFIIDKASNI